MEERKTKTIAENSHNSNSLVFTVNGERFELSPGVLHPSTTLLQFLRSNTRFKGVKLGCGQGGCGACLVLLSKYDPDQEEVENFTVSSCLTLLCSVNGCSITTSEGIGNSKDGFHPIQERFTGFHASQCGFCTPGMCMSLYSALVNAEKTNRPEPPPGFSKLTASEAEKSISGNLCRCTGYRPIADACKSFAADVDMEDLGINSFWKRGDTRDVKASGLPVYNPKNQNCIFPESLKAECKSAMLLDLERYSWYSPSTLEQLQSLLETDWTVNAKRTRLVVGNTGMGYYPELQNYDIYIDLRKIPQLSTIKRDQKGIEIGATVTISKAILALREENKSKLSSENKLVFCKLAEHMERIASMFIRNSASVGGNLVMAQRNSFPSDIATILLAVGSLVNIMTGLKHEKLTLEKFLSRPPLDPGSVLLSVQIPYWKPKKTGCSTETNSKLLFETHRAAPRPLGNALSYLNAAFLADVSPSKTGVVVNKIQLAFGAYGTKHAIRARMVEEYFEGKTLSVAVLYEALKLVRASVVPEDGVSHPAYRSSLAVSYLFEFLCPLVDAGAGVSDDLLGRFTSTSLEHTPKVQHPGYQCDPSGTPALLSSAKLVVESSGEYDPVGKSIRKYGATIQASGEAVYVDDIPSPANCLHGAFICSTKPLAWVKDVNFDAKSLPREVTAVISYKDIPKGGENIGSQYFFGSEPLFADDLTRFAGQPVAFVVANTQKHADMAAEMAVVDYDTKDLQPPILTVEEAVERSSFFEIASSAYPQPVGDFSKGMAEADHKILSAQIQLGSQYYFYMETQTALAVPDEDNCMVVYTSSQFPEFSHRVIAKCLGVPENNVRVVTRRVGGGFGGKAMRAMPVATACALAAHKLRRPVRIYVNRKTDMVMTGGRHPMKITYSVGCKSNGKITALHLDILINAGMYADMSPNLPNGIMGALKKYDWGALSTDIKVCKTNQSTKSMMRAPGNVQGSFIAEAVIEHVASMLSMNVDSVRKQNLHTFDSINKFYNGIADDPLEYTLPSIWDKLAKSSNLDQRIEMIKEVNHHNTWRKNGISRIPITYAVALLATPGKVSILWDGSIVVEVGGIEMGQGLWTKVTQVAAFALRPIQCDETEDLLKKIRVIQADTLSLVQGGITGGSTKSESSCEAVRLACNILVERLTPLKEELQGQMGSITWDNLILQAHNQSVNLSASSYFVPEAASARYLNYGAAVSEVEVNLLTGQTSILRTDIIYDCGKSMNPAVDLGQIEGCFVQGIGFFMQEEVLTNSDGLEIGKGIWTYEIPTLDTIPKQFNVEILNSGHHPNRILSSKASGEPPLIMAAAVHCATRAAIEEARKQLVSWNGLDGSDLAFQLEVPATMPVVKELCGLNSVEMYLESLLASS